MMGLPALGILLTGRNFQEQHVLFNERVLTTTVGNSGFDPFCLKARR